MQGEMMNRRTREIGAKKGLERRRGAEKERRLPVVSYSPLFTGFNPKIWQRLVSHPVEDEQTYARQQKKSVFEACRGREKEKEGKSHKTHTSRRSSFLSPLTRLYRMLSRSLPSGYVQYSSEYPIHTQKAPAEKKMSSAGRNKED